MRNPLPALAAFSKDAQAVSARTGDDDASLGGWLAVTKAAERLAVLSQGDREAYVGSLVGALLPPIGSRPTLIHDALPAPENSLSQLAERLRSEAEEMERAGCLEMAFSTVAAVCRLTSDADVVSRMLAAAHLGRVARQLGDFRTASDCYASVVSVATRERDGPLEAMGWLGLGALARMRGNRPEERRTYEAALACAQPGGHAERSAHHGLMNAAISENRLPDALQHGWRAFDLSAENDDARAMIVSNLALTALRGDFSAAAVHGFLHVLSLSNVARIRLTAYGELLRALANLGDRVRMDAFEAQAIAESERANMPFEVAYFFVLATEAWCALPDFDRAEASLARAESMLSTSGFHELANRAETLRERMREAAVRHTPLRETLWRAPSASGWDEQVNVSIRRLAGLST